MSGFHLADVLVVCWLLELFIVFCISRNMIFDFYLDEWFLCKLLLFNDLRNNRSVRFVLFMFVPYFSLTKLIIK